MKMAENNTKPDITIPDIKQTTATPPPLQTNGVASDVNSEVPDVKFPESGGVVMNPDEMIENTKTILQTLLETSPIGIRRKLSKEKKELKSSEEEEKVLNGGNRKRRRIKRTLESSGHSSSSYEFQTSPLRKSLSPKFSKSSSKSKRNSKTNSKKCHRDDPAGKVSPTPFRRAGNRRRTTRTTRRISYQDLPDNFNNSNSSEDSGSDFVNTPGTSSSGSSRDTSSGTPVSPATISPDSSPDMSITRKRKRKVKMHIPQFGAPPRTRRSNGFVKYEDVTHRDRVADIDDCEIVSQEFIESETYSSSENEKCRNKKRPNVLHSSSDSSCSIALSTVDEEDEQRAVEKKKHVVVRRSARYRPSRYSPRFFKSLDSLLNAKQKGVKQAKRILSNSGSSDSDDSADKDNEDNKNADKVNDNKSLGDSDDKRLCVDNVKSNSVTERMSKSDTENEAKPYSSNRTFTQESDHEIESTRTPTRKRIIIEDDEEEPMDTSGKINQEREECGSTISGKAMAIQEDVVEEEEEMEASSQLEPHILEIIRSGDIKKVPEDITPQTHPTLLCEACISCTSNMAEYLILKYGYDVFTKVGNWLPLTYAISHNNAETVTVLLSAMSHKPHKVTNELIKRCAGKLVKQENLDCLRSIIQWDNDTPMSSAHVPFLEQVLEDEVGSRRLLGAIGTTMNTAALQLIIQQDINIRECEYGYLLLHNCVNAWSTASDNDNAIDYLDYLGLYMPREWMEMRDKDDFTVLMRSAHLGYHTLLRRLISFGADVNAVDNENTSALHLAACQEHIQCVQVLMEPASGTDLTLTDNSGWTAVMYAVFMEHTDIVHLLLSDTLTTDREDVLSYSSNGAPNYKKSSALLTSLCALLHRRYKPKEKELRNKNRGMVMELLKIVAHCDAYRQQLNIFVDMCSNEILDNVDILQELFSMPHLVTTSIKWNWVQRRLGRGCTRNVQIDRQKYFSSLSKAFSYDYKVYKTSNSGTPSRTGCSVSVTFRGENGIGEGPTKEFFSMFGEELVKEKLFRVSSDDGSLLFTYLLTLNKDKTSKFEKFHKYYWMCGSMLAQALIRGYHVTHKPNIYILNYLIHGKKELLHDLEKVDKLVYNNILGIPDEDFPDMEIPLGVDIENPTTGVNTVFAMSKFLPADKTATCKQGYLTLFARSKLYDLCQHELNVMRAAFNNLFPVQFCKMFSAHEISTLLTGNTDCDVFDWQRHCGYSSCVTKEIKDMFWECIKTLSSADKLLLLHFTTGLSALPPGGFRNLPGSTFTISVNLSAKKDETLPTAAVCFNLLTLPPYSSVSIMRKFLLIAVRYGAKGFSFT